MALSFNGSSDTITLADEADFDFERTQALTFSCWVNPNVTRSGINTNHTIYSKYDSSAPNRGISWSLDWNDANFVSNKTGFNFFISNTFIANSILGNTNSTDLQNGIWYHLALTYDGSSSASGIACYINGTSESYFVVTDNLSASILNDITPYLGSRNNTDTYMNGSMAEFGIWTVVLSVSEIVALAKGYSPAMVRTGSLQSYVPIVRSAVNYKRAVTTITGTTVVDHPRIIMPARPMIGHNVPGVFIQVRPNADSIDGGWTNEASSNVNLFASIDETSVDDADYIRSEDNPTADLCRVKLETIGAVQEPFRVIYRYKKSGASTIDLTARLIENTTTIAEWAHTNISTSFVTATQTLTTPEFEAITDFTDLYLEFEANP